MTEVVRAPDRHRGPTLKDVARLAGVSVATASKALNGRSEVHPETRQRVIDVAERISFTPNTLARSLLVGQTGTVGLLTNDLEGRFSLPILMGAEDAFGTGKMSVLLCDARGDAIREQYHLRALLGRRVDGLIVVGSSTDPRPSLGQELPIPVVYAYAPSADPRDASLVPDNVAGGRQIVDHLVATGRSRIAHVSGDSAYAAARERAQGVTEALAGAGLPLIGGQTFYGSWTEAWGRSATHALLDQHPDIDALVCGSDQVARGALEVLRERGVKVPQQIAVTGFDNWEVLSADSRPPLTTVDMGLEALGRLAAERLFAAMDGRPTAGEERLPCRVVVRGSTDAGL
ncbi:LacI family DNA-binding transcriptional regulator [Symbioplanes lichenis]|uniref:LacI family DNA-binding transcriptional regulator n=1 Tax=Symbioplanes lichenis TaxID=1629072 RepID=UPI0027390DD8|nr:LacI family DNA-binding transcriptional regulator [Actinoplanes lichenis]